MCTTEWNDKTIRSNFSHNVLDQERRLAECNIIINELEMSIRKGKGRTDLHRDELESQKIKHDEILSKLNIYGGVSCSGCVESKEKLISELKQWLILPFVPREAINKEYYSECRKKDLNELISKYQDS